MIASYLHNFIFIKTRKTAGTTMELVLAQACGPDDIVTPISWREEKARGKGKVVCRNYSRQPAVERQIREALLSGERKGQEAAKALLRDIDFYNHMPASKIAALVPAQFWERAYKFTVERHPYEKVVSRAYFRYEQGRHGGFAGFLDEQVRGGGYSDVDRYSIDGKVAVDEILRQETLHDDLKRLGARLGIPIPDVLPQSKSTRRTDLRPARDILSEEQKAVVRNVCRREFELLGYEP